MERIRDFNSRIRYPEESQRSDLVERGRFSFDVHRFGVSVPAQIPLSATGNNVIIPPSFLSSRSSSFSTPPRVTSTVSSRSSRTSLFHSCHSPLPGRVLPSVPSTLPCTFSRGSLRLFHDCTTDATHREFQRSTYFNFH